MKTKRTSRIVATTLVTALAGIGLTLPAAGATGQAASPTHDKTNNKTLNKAHDKALQAGVDAILKTGTVGVLAQSTGPRGSRYATAGVADTATGAAARSGDRFRIASASKTFVATVVLQLVGEGRLSLDDTVDHWLPGVVSGNGNDGSRITVRQLLQHTSGLFNYTADFARVEQRGRVPGGPLHHLDPGAAGRHRDAARAGLRARRQVGVLQHQLHPRRNDHPEGHRAQLAAAGHPAHHPPAGPARHLRPDDGLPDPRPPPARLLRLRRRPGRRSTPPRSTRRRPVRPAR